MKYLLLGGTGFIGSHLEGVLGRENDVVVLGRAEIDFTKCQDFIRYIEDVDVVVHMISTIIPSDDITGIDLEIQENLFPTLTLFKNASQLKKKVVFISSGGAVYGESRKQSKETDPTNPICNYGIVKLTIEKYLEMFNRYYGLEYRIIRPSNPYSEKIYHQKKQGIIPVIVDSILENEEMVIYGDSQVRDYIYIDDLIEGIKAVLEYRGKEKVFNIGTGVGYSVDEVIKRVEAAMGQKLKARHRPARRCDVSNNVLDISLIEKETGWKPKISIDAGISKVIEGRKNERI